MKIEKWQFNDKEIDVPIVEDDEIEKNDDEILENTQPIPIMQEEDNYE